MIYGKKEYENINSNISRLIEKNKILISAHRGARGGNVIENTLPAFTLAYKLGADIIELDISKSTDNVLYVFHDTTEYYNLHMEKNIQTLSSKEIDELFLYNSLGVQTLQHVNKFIDVLDTFTSKDQLFNIDRAYDIEKCKAVFAILDKYPDVIDKVIYKTPIKEEILEYLNNHPVKYIYMPMVYHLKDLELLEKYPNINAVGYEVIIRDGNSEFLQNNFLEGLQKKGLFIWINSITIGDGAKWSLSNFYNDNNSLFKGPEYGWHQLIKWHASIIQTDWVYLLKDYIKCNEQINHKE